MLHTLKDLEYISNSKYEAYLKLKLSSDEEAYFSDSGKETRSIKVKSKTIPSKRFKSLAFEAFQKKKISEEEFSALISQNKEKIRAIFKLIGNK